MKVIVCKTYQEMSSKAAELIAKQVTDNPKSVLGLATGSTPIGMYEALAAMSLDFSQITTFNLDEYYPIQRQNDQSYWYFMNQNLFRKININPENINIPNGETDDVATECAEYEKRIEQKGGIDLQVLGIGQNGHVGFNEPADSLEALTHMTDLTADTIDANARFFSHRDEVPKKALTMGMATIMKARSIVLLASGKEKAPAIKALLSNRITTNCPASMLCMHPNVTLVCDEAAYGK